MPLSDLDRELRNVLTAQSVSVTRDDRHKFVGSLTVLLRDGETLVNCYMDACPEESMLGAAGAETDDGGIGGSAVLRRPSAFCQLRMWVDF